MRLERFLHRVLSHSLTNSPIFINIFCVIRWYLYFPIHGRIQRGTGGTDPPPLKNHKNIGLLSNTGPDPLNNHKAT